MGLFRSSSSDNSNLSSNDTQQMTADATVLATGNADQQAQAQNLTWALTEDQRNQTAGR